MSLSLFLIYNLKEFFRSDKKTYFEKYVIFNAI